LPAFANGSLKGRFPIFRLPPLPNLQPMAWRLADVANQRSLINVPFGDEPSPRHALLGWHGFQAAYRVAQSMAALPLCPNL